MLYTCIALQTSAGLDAILDFRLSIPINALSLLPHIWAPITSSLRETQLFQPVIRNTPITAKFWKWRRVTWNTPSYPNSASGQLQYLLVPVVQVVQAVRPGHHVLQVSGYTHCQCHHHFDELAVVWWGQQLWDCTTGGGSGVDGQVVGLICVDYSIGL